MSTNGEPIPLPEARVEVATERPRTIDELREAVTRRAGEGLALYPRGGATALDYGRTPRRRGVAIDVRSLDRVVDYPAADMTITVEAGLTLAGLQSALAAEGQRLPLDAPHADRATIGGIWATATSGPRRFGWGRTRDLIIGVRFVASDGAVVKGGGRVVKNVAGYDFPRLLTGSMGSLGIIAELTLKVRPIPESSALAWISLASVDEAGTLLDRLNTSATRPVAVELLNRTAARRLSEPLGLPAAEWVVIVGFEDNTASVAWQVGALEGEVGNGTIAYLRDREAAPLWTALADHPAGEGYGPVSLTANVPPSTVASLAARLDPARWAVQAHAGSGIVHIHLSDDAPQEPLAAEVDTLRAAAVAKGGNLIVPRCPAPAKDRLRVWGEPRADWPLMERIKAALDPRGLMNPGRFVGKM